MKKQDVGWEKFFFAKNQDSKNQKSYISTQKMHLFLHVFFLQKSRIKGSKKCEKCNDFDLFFGP